METIVTTYTYYGKHPIKNAYTRFFSTGKFLVLKMHEAAQRIKFNNSYYSANYTGSFCLWRESPPPVIVTSPNSLPLIINREIIIPPEGPHVRIVGISETGGVVLEFGGQHYTRLNRQAVGQTGYYKSIWGSGQSKMALAPYHGKIKPPIFKANLQIMSFELIGVNKLTNNIKPMDLATPTAKPLFQVHWSKVVVRYSQVVGRGVFLTDLRGKYWLPYRDEDGQLYYVRNLPELSNRDRLKLFKRLREAAKDLTEQR